MLATEFTHPDDAAALKMLESIPVLPKVVKKVMDFGMERFYKGINLATKIRLSPTQLPELYEILPPICRRLGIAEPEFYLELDPNPNAYAFGDTYTAITINSGLVEMLTREELKAIVAHECGHILCRHMLYHTLAMTLVDGMSEDSGLRLLAEPINYALMFWNRKGELSCDRVSAFICDPATAARALGRLAGGPDTITGNLNLVELAEQAEQYEKYATDGFWNKTLQMSAVLGMTHPFTSVRISEVLRWVASEDYKKLREKYPSCPVCFEETAPGQKYCQHCGSKL